MLNQPKLNESEEKPSEARISADRISTESQKPKRMLKISRNESGKLLAEINFSSLDLILTCPRKAQYLLQQNLHKETQSPPLIFGSAIHKALETWYSLPYDQRALKERVTQANFANPTEGHTGAIKALQAFVTAMEPLSALEDDSRSISNGLKILQEYFKLYINDGLEIYHDDKGPCIEREIEFVIHEDESMRVTFFGTIDAIMRDTFQQQVYVMDHKTTSALGKEFFNRLNPNYQYTGYILGAQKVLGIDTNSFLINGIQVAKTKAGFARQFTYRTEEDFEELRKACVHAIKLYAECLDTGYFPQHSPGPCSNYGGCQYLDLCQTPAQMRDTLVKNIYAQN